MTTEKYHFSNPGITLVQNLLAEFGQAPSDIWS